MSAKHAVSPLAPKSIPTLPRIAGVKLGVARSGVRYTDRDDVLLAVVPAGATIAGVLTKSKTCSAPVDWCRKNLARGKVRAIIVNAGNANAFTGKLGEGGRGIDPRGRPGAGLPAAQRGLHGLDRGDRPAPPSRRSPPSCRP
jgi:hypothetical protein